MSTDMALTPEQADIQNRIARVIGGRNVGDVLVALATITSATIGFASISLSQADAMCDQISTALKETVREDWSLSRAERFRAGLQAHAGGVKTH